jgi:RimJ/RimL family protein N-acetyltransferase
MAALVALADGGCVIIPRAIESERLLLRCPTAADGRAIHAAIVESWPQLSQWMQWARECLPTVEQTTARAALHEAWFEARTAADYAVFEKSTGAFAGKVSLFDFDWTVPRAEIGYWLASSMTGRGLATEAVLTLTELAKSLGLVRVDLRCAADNERSRKLADRTGYRLEGVLRQHRRTPQGILADTCIYAQVF